jgi:hypothetical protein
MELTRYWILHKYNWFARSKKVMIKMPFQNSKSMHGKDFKRLMTARIYFSVTQGGLAAWRR